MAYLAPGEAGPKTPRNLIRRRVHVTGLVQGVGFRPHVYRLATEDGLGGWVLNSPRGVTVEVEGPFQAVSRFIARLESEPPRLARVESVHAVEVPPLGETSFSIVPSHEAGPRTTLIPPETAMCDACRRELQAPGDRRFAYAFTNCTDCGPRYSIITGLPYDRPQTSMSVFQMCAHCREEYENPAGRRFHAQPNACPACGPRVWLEDGCGRVLSGRDGDRLDAAPRDVDWPDAPFRDADWPRIFRGLIREGAIVAIKGLGGFHLACDARNEEAVARLRDRKRRPHKPFAVMARDLSAARRYVRIGEEAERQLTSPAAPIVILEVRPTTGGGGVAPSVNPGTGTLGLMLAYTPLHFLLFDEAPPGEPGGGPDEPDERSDRGGSDQSESGRDRDRIDLLVMTSANPSGLPIIHDGDAARQWCAGIADYYLLHDREIVNRCEDSVIRVLEGDTPLGAGTDGEPTVIFYRRSRGYAPAPLDVTPTLPEVHLTGRTVVLGAGGEMKSTFCLLRGGHAFLSPHLGEMEYVESLEAYRETYDRYVALLDAPPAAIAFDPHPAYLVSRMAHRLGEAGVSRIPVFHHHAHLVSCLADNHLPGNDEVLGLVCDGTGYGPDGNIWGFELLAGSAGGFRRLGHLAEIAVPGGDAVARRPVRSAVAHLFRAVGPSGVKRLARLYPRYEEETEMLRRLLESGRAYPRTSSCGRLFDAVAAMAGLGPENTYEGQAAVELADLAERPTRPGATPVDEPPPARYRFQVLEGDETVLVEPSPFLKALLDDLEGGPPSPSDVAWLFHRCLAQAMDEAVRAVARRTGIRRVCLSGGTFQNALLTLSLVRRLRGAGLEVYPHRDVPPGDGGLALGQAVSAAWRDRLKGS